jgi:undecaprenyl-diphosphatase
MPWYQTLVLALLQGLTEILPISSSAHLILVPWLTGWTDQGLAFDVALHVGTLAAVVLFFRRELGKMAAAWGRSIAGGGMDTDARLAWMVLAGTLPAALAGLLLKDVVEGFLRQPLSIAVSLIGFGLLLWAADRRGQNDLEERSLTWGGALLIGCAQALALNPGTSRSGITMTAGLFLGLSRISAARYSFLLSTPIIFLAGAHQMRKLILESTTTDWGAILTGAAVAAASTYVTIGALLKILARFGMAPFVVYRLCLGGLLLVLIAAGWL